MQPGEDSIPEQEKEEPMVDQDCCQELWSMLEQPVPEGRTAPVEGTRTGAAHAQLQPTGRDSVGEAAGEMFVQGKRPHAGAVEECDVCVSSTPIPSVLLRGRR